MSDAVDPIFRLPPFTITQVLTPLSETSDWSHTFLRVPELWKQTKGAGIKVAVLDTGVDSHHPDLQGAIIATKDFTGSPYGPEDRQAHGTWCCGMIGARAGNDIGVRGVAPECQILSGKVLGDDGSGSDDGVVAGILWATAQGADIISMSLGGPAMGSRMRAALRAFVAQPGKFVFAAAGNDGRPNSVNYPAAWEECICVAAVDKNGRVARFSSRGPRVDIAAPGVEMLSTTPGGYSRMSGTSMATPTAAAIGALCLAKHRMMGEASDLRTYQDMREHLKKTAKDVGTPGHDNDYGFGLLDPEKLLDFHPIPVVPPVIAPGTGTLPVELVTGGRIYAGVLKDQGPASLDTTEYGDG